MRLPADPIALLDALPRFSTSGGAAYRPGLERIEALLDELGNPHLACPTAHVAGTNGKGSTASYMAAIATASGLRAGLHTSPHLVSVAERMRIDGKPAPMEWIAGTVDGLRDAIGRIRPSYFEATLALSFAWFAAERADFIVVEVGLGGRLDATNVVDPAVCAIADVGLDHMDLLGDTVEAIAGEKAGIMKFGVPVVVADSGPGVERVFVETADRVGSPLHLVRKEAVVETLAPLTLRTPVRLYEGLPLGLPGPVQARNAALATRACELAGTVEGLGSLLWADAVRAGLADVSCLSGIRGRMETLLTRPLVVADVAHNTEGLRAALETLIGMHGSGRRFVLLSVMADKPVADMVREVVGTGATVVPVRIPVDRALPPERLADAVREAGGSTLDTLDAGPAGVPDWIRANASAGDAVLVAGSHMLVGPVLQAWT